MKRYVFLMLSILIVILVNAFAFAQKHMGSESLFDVEQANTQYELIKKKLLGNNGLNTLSVYVNQLEDLHTQAKKCVISATGHLKLIDELLKTTQFDLTVPVQHDDHQYLQNKKLFYTQSLSQCRLFVYRSQELLTDYRDKIQQLSKYQILERRNPIWKMNLASTWDGLSSFDFQKMRVDSGVETLALNQFIFGLMLVIVAMIIGVYIRVMCSRWFSMSSMHVSLRAAFVVFRSMVAPLLVFGAMSSFLNAIYNDLPSAPPLELISHGILIYFLAYTVSRYLFYPSATESNLLKLPVLFGRTLHIRFVWLISLLLVSYIINLITKGQSLSNEVLELARMTFVTLFTSVTLWFFLAFFSHYKDKNGQSVLAAFAKLCLWVLFLSTLLSEWLGYHRLVIYVGSGILLTVLATLLAIGVCRLIETLHECFDDKRYALARKLHVLFGVRFNKRLHEVALIKFSLYTVVLFYYLLTVMKIWQVSENWVSHASNWVFDGFNIGYFHIVPARFVAAILTFAIVFLVGRFIAAMVARKAHFEGEEDTQIAISTIIIYISFAVALLFALVVTRVDFTSLAIIAGALSVGIGLGLQTIVNNFVSGLILLLEKPIKPGDRVVIDQVEGFVKRIRIRSTQITTVKKEDVIVPNAELITNKVTNYMFRDKFSRVVCQVGVAYGSDVELVRRVLLEVAYKNELVVHDAPNEPLVLFSKFSDSSLNFELWCVIYDVNKKYVVVSELNFAIDAAFRENNICIAFPQRDIHIKDYQVIKISDEYRESSVHDKI